MCFITFDLIIIKFYSVAYPFALRVLKFIILLFTAAADSIKKILDTGA